MSNHYLDVQLNTENVSTRFHLPLGTTVVGSEETCHLVLSEGIIAVAPTHCEFRCTEDSCQVQDLGTEVGTWVGDEQLAPEAWYRLQPGDVVSIGMYYLTYWLQETVNEGDDEQPEEEKRPLSPPPLPLLHPQPTRLTLMRMVVGLETAVSLRHLPSACSLLSTTATGMTYTAVTCNTCPAFTTTTPSPSASWPCWNPSLHPLNGTSTASTSTSTPTRLHHSFCPGWQPGLACSLTTLGQKNGSANFCATRPPCKHSGERPLA